MGIILFLRMGFLIRQYYLNFNSDCPWFAKKEENEDE